MSTHETDPAAGRPRRVTSGDEGLRTDADCHSPVASATPTPASEERCFHCSGTGKILARSGGKVPCNLCGGTGHRAPAAAPQPAPRRCEHRCDACDAEWDALCDDLNRTALCLMRAEAAERERDEARTKHIEECAEADRMERERDDAKVSSVEGWERARTAESALSASRAEAAELRRALELYQAAIYRQGNAMQGYRPAVDEEKFREAETAARAAQSSNPKEIK